jgi:hypothetical protein
MDYHKIVPEFKKSYRPLICNNYRKLAGMAFALKMLYATCIENESTQT